MYVFISVIIIVMLWYYYIRKDVDNQFCWQSIYQKQMLIPLQLNFMLDSYTFTLQATIDHHGFSVYSCNYTSSVYCEKTCYCSDDKITVMWYKSYPRSPPHMSWFINCLWSAFIIRTLKMGNRFSMVPAHFVDLTKYRSRNRHRNKLDGQCVCSWWPPVQFW